MERNMITNTIISTETYYELIKVKQLAESVYQVRDNFTKLCDALIKLYAHFDKVIS